MQLGKKIATLVGAGVIATGGLALSAAPAYAGGCHVGQCGTVENNSSRNLGTCTAWKGDNDDDHYYSGYHRHCTKDHSVWAGHHDGMHSKPPIDIDAIWVPGHAHIKGHERCLYPWGHSYKRKYKFPTNCAIVASSVGKA